MEYDDHLMKTFLAMARCDRATTEDGVFEVRLTRARTGERVWYEIDCEAVDELVSRGWLRLVNADEVEATEAGLYHLNRWLERRRKELRRKQRSR